MDGGVSPLGLSTMVHDRRLLESVGLALDRRGVADMDGRQAPASNFLNIHNT